MNALALHALFFLSGAAGLIYQVVWVRQFGNIFGNTVHSAALVTGVFMLGLGLGSWWLGRWADQALARGRSLLRVYGLFEVAIGVLGLLIALALPLLEPLSASLSGYVVGENGWHLPSTGTHALRYGVALVLLLPITVLMGGTLPVLIRHVLRDEVRDAGWKIGALFGINTAGAAVGALAVAFTLVPAIGLFATQCLAVLVNLGVGLLALRMAGPARPKQAAAPVSDPDAGGWRILGPASVAIAISGFAAMGMEIVWFRFLQTVLGPFRSTFGLLLAVMLVGMWWGAILAGALVRRVGRPALLFSVSQLILVIATAAAFMAYDRADLVNPELLAIYREGSPTTQRLVDLWVIVRAAIWMVGLPALMMGFAYPMANAVVQRARAGVGARAGLLYLANTLGAVGGSICAGFVFIPLIGVQRSVLVLMGVALLAVVPLGIAGWRSAAPPKRPRATMASVAICLVGLVPLGWWASLGEYDLFLRTFHRKTVTERLLAISEGPNETIVITEDSANGSRMLYTNNHPMSATRYDGLRYMRAFSHVPLLAMDAPKTVLVICFGVGNTVRAAALHPSVERLEVADLSLNVLRHAGWFRKWNDDVLSDPRVAVFVNDGRQHLRMQPEGRYDLITLEPPPIRQAGMSALYSREFYALAHGRLRVGGHLTQWLPAYQVDAPVTRAMVRAFIDVFPDAVMLSGVNAELILVGVKGGAPRLNLDQVRRRLAAAPAVHADLRRIDLGSLTELAGTFAADAATLRAATADAPALTDDLPLSEYGKASFGQTLIPPDLFDVTRVGTWCPDCASLEDLPAYLELMAATYAAPSYLTQGSTVPATAGAVLPTLDEGHARVWRGSGYIRRLFPDLLKARR